MSLATIGGRHDPTSKAQGACNELAIRADEQARQQAAAAPAAPAQTSTTVTTQSGTTPTPETSKASFRSVGSK